MDGAQVPRMIYFRYSTGNTLNVKCCQVGGRVKVIYYYCWEAVYGRPRVEQPLVQILVVVANTQVENVLLEDRSGEGFHINSNYI